MKCSRHGTLGSQHHCWLPNLVGPGQMTFLTRSMYSGSECRYNV
jgi:hypothetical protein